MDILEIDRLEEVLGRYGRRFLERVYTESELDEIEGRPASLAARFAAKEAVAKALGTGIGEIGWQEIEVLRGAKGEPVLRLSGRARRLAEEQRLQNWAISLSHSREYAVAVVVAAPAASSSSVDSAASVAPASSEEAPPVASSPEANG